MSERLLRVLVRQVLQEKRLPGLGVRFEALPIVGIVTSTSNQAKPNNSANTKATGMRFTPESSIAGIPEKALKDAGLIKIKNLGKKIHASNWETWSYSFPDTPDETEMVIWMGDDNTKAEDPDKVVISDNMLGIFAEHATVEGLGGVDRLTDATAGLMSPKYGVLTAKQKALTGEIYYCCVELAKKAFAGFDESPAGSAINGNDVSTTSQVDVVMQSKDATTADVHVKFNDKDRMFGIQAGDFKVTTKVLLDKFYQPGEEGSKFSKIESGAAQYKVARNAFLSKTYEVTRDDGTKIKTTPYDVITSLRWDNTDIKDEDLASGAACPVGSPHACPAGRARIDQLAKMKEPDIDPDTGLRSRKKLTKKQRASGKSDLKDDKSLELRMFDSGLKIGSQTMREAYLEFLDTHKVKEKFLLDMTKFFKEGSPPVYFFNYRTSPTEVTVSKAPVDVFLDVTLLKADISKFSIEDVTDENSTYLYKVKYDGESVFKIETRTRGTQNHPPQVKVDHDGEADTTLKTKVTIGPCSAKVFNRAALSQGTQGSVLEPDDPGYDYAVAASHVRKGQLIGESLIHQFICEFFMSAEKLTGTSKGKIKLGATNYLEESCSTLFTRKNNMISTSKERAIRALKESIHAAVQRILKEQLDPGTKRDVEKIVQKAAKKEIDKAVKTTIEKMIKQQVEKEVDKVVTSAMKKESESMRNDMTKEHDKMFKDKRLKDEVIDISKRVMKRVYRELAISSPHVIDKIKNV